MNSQLQARGLLLLGHLLEFVDGSEEIRRVIDSESLRLELRVDKKDVAEAMHRIIFQRLLLGATLVLNNFLLQNMVAYRDY